MKNNEILGFSTYMGIESRNALGPATLKYIQFDIVFRNGQVQIKDVNE
jgi:protein associated with RNAse G/E